MGMRNARCVCPHLCSNNGRRLVASVWRIVSWPSDMVANSHLTWPLNSFVPECGHLSDMVAKKWSQKWPADMVAEKCLFVLLCADWPVSLFPECVFFRKTPSTTERDRQAHTDTERCRATVTHQDTPRARLASGEEHTKT